MFWVVEAELACSMRTSFSLKIFAASFHGNSIFMWSSRAWLLKILFLLVLCWECLVASFVCPQSVWILAGEYSTPTFPILVPLSFLGSNTLSLPFSRFFSAPSEQLRKHLLVTPIPNLAKCTSSARRQVGKGLDLEPCCLCLVFIAHDIFIFYSGKFYLCPVAVSSHLALPHKYFCDPSF